MKWSFVVVLVELFFAPWESPLVQHLQQPLKEMFKDNGKQKQRIGWPETLENESTEIEEPWSSSFGKRLVFKRSRVQIPARVLVEHFLIIICCKNCIAVWGLNYLSSCWIFFHQINLPLSSFLPFLILSLSHTSVSVLFKF